ncbi:putative Enoyl reductase (ER) domain-containing protein [Seiridium cardinale]
MAENNEQQTMRAWLYSSASGGLEKALKLSEATVKPLSGDQVLVKVHSTSLNPADYKMPELGMLARLAVSTPASPGMDFAGTVVKVGDAVKSADTFRVGEKVFGRIAPQQHGTLAEFIAAKPEGIARLPDGVSEGDASCVGTAGLTAYQSIAPHVKAGDKIFINGGSGGTGTFGIQFAKALGCHVTTSCSTRNVELVKGLGADEVIDYTKENVSETLKSKGLVFKHVVDNVGTPNDLFKAADHFLVPDGKFVQIGGEMSLTSASTLVSRSLLPSFLGGGKRSFQFMVLQPKHDEYVHIGKLMQEGKVKAVIEETFDFQNAPKAFEKLKSKRTRGNVVVKVAK